jgi:perosamine synthetase
MITTDDGELATRLRFLRDHAMSKTRRYFHTEVGFNYRITNLQAAIGLAQVHRIEELLGAKRAIFQRYQKNLSGIKNSRTNFTKSGYHNSYWMMCFEHDAWNEDSRSAFMAELKRRKIDSRPFFCPVSDMPMYAAMGVVTPVTHEVAYHGINLPSFVGMSDEQIDYVCENVIEALKA